MKRFFVIALILTVSLIIGVLGILTAMKLTTQKSIAPTAPEVKPRAEVNPTTAPQAACTAGFTLNPTLTPTAGPSPTPGPSVTPTASPTPGINVHPKCTGLSASPTSGDMPLLVTFVACGNDENSGYISGFEFTFGDTETKKIEETFKTSDCYTQTHMYTKPGSYVATVRVRDNNGEWSDIPDVCKQTITTSGEGPTVTPFPSSSITRTPVPSTEIFDTPAPTEAVVVPKIPQSGSILPGVLSIVGGVILLGIGWVLL